MVYTKNGYLSSVDDNMDSAVRRGLVSMCGLAHESDIRSYEISPGLLVRCPDGSTASNPKNFTRDNMLPLVAGLYADGHYDIIKRVFYSRLKSFLFMQNTERDVSGSKKYLRPHEFYKDSNPNSRTVLKEFIGGSFVSRIPRVFDNKGNVAEVESRIVDGPDPLLPNHIWFLIKAARLYYLYPFAIIGIPFFLLTLIAHSLGKHNEENQMIAESYVNGNWALKLYKLVNKKWKARSEKYWTERNEIEYHNIIVDMMEKV